MTKVPGSAADCDGSSDVQHTVGRAVSAAATTALAPAARQPAVVGGLEVWAGRRARLEERWPMMSAIILGNRTRLRRLLPPVRAGGFDSAACGSAMGSRGHCGDTGGMGADSSQRCHDGHTPVDYVEAAPDWLGDRESGHDPLYGVSVRADDIRRVRALFAELGAE